MAILEAISDRCHCMTPWETHGPILIFFHIAQNNLFWALKLEQNGQKQPKLHFCHYGELLFLAYLGLPLPVGGIISWPQTWSHMPSNPAEVLKAIGPTFGAIKAKTLQNNPLDFFPTIPFWGSKPSPSQCALRSKYVRNKLVYFASYCSFIETYDD